MSIICRGTRKNTPLPKPISHKQKKHAQAMKAVDPTIKVSVCASPVAFHKNGFEKNVDQRNWDSALAAADQFYDAYTVHVYAYRTARKKEIEEYRGYLFGWIHCDIDDAMDYYKKLFPNKEMWITEWNIANPANRVANTQLHAMYAGDFFLKMLTHTRALPMRTFTYIAGPGKGFPTFSPIARLHRREPTGNTGANQKRTLEIQFGAPPTIPSS